MTTDNTQELDEILDRIEELSLLVSAENSVTGSNVYGSPSAAVNRVKQAILDWHNKQIESLYELLDEVVEPMDEDCSYDHHDYCQSHFLHDNPCPYARAKALVAERNKLKED